MLSTPVGSLWEPGRSNGYHTGTQTVTGGASDTGGGLQSLTVAADGKPLQTYTATCDYTYPKPCPSSTGPQTFTLPTSQLQDGPHTLTLTAVGAAGNETTASEQIMTANNPPPAPALLTITPPTAGGYTFTSRWQSPGEQIVPITGALYQLCPTSGIGSCTTPSAAPIEGPASITAPSEGTWTLEVWYTNAAGLGSPSRAATTTFDAPATPHGGIGGSGGAIAGSSSQPLPGTGPGKNANSPPPLHPLALRVKARVRGRRLLVKLAGMPNTRVKLSYTAHSHTRTTAHTKTVVRLDTQGQHTTNFPIPARWANIQITAQPANSQTVTRTTLHQLQPRSGSQIPPSSARHYRGSPGGVRGGVCRLAVGAWVSAAVGAGAVAVVGGF